MDYTYTVPLFLLSILFLITTTFSRRKSKLPPGPFPFPIIGSILQIGSLPHQTMTTLSKEYGPLMSLKIGSLNTIVISSPTIAKELLQKHDLSLSGRLQPEGQNVFSHLKNSVIILSGGSDQWKKFRRIIKENIFTWHHLEEASKGLRKKVVKDLHDYVHECCLKGEAIDIGQVGHTTTLNLVSNFLFSKNLTQYHHLSSSHEFEDVMSEMMELNGRPNLSDFFPILRTFDLQGIRKENKVCITKLFEIFDKIIDQRLAENKKGNSKNDPLDLLLNLHLQHESELSRGELKHLFMDLFIGASDATSSSLLWAMVELLRNPEKMVKAQTELKQAIVKDGVIEESDISNLPYLKAIVNETFRLHPPVPFLVPHRAEANVQLDDFTIPKNAYIIFNVWAIGRDSNVWSDPELFKPERFIGCDIDYKGNDFELIPFGAGRRICPGQPLGHKMLLLMLGSLLYSFDWKLEGDTKNNDLDMRERFNFTLEKVVPLRVIPVKLLKD